MGLELFTEKRKVGGSTPPLLTAYEQQKDPGANSPGVFLTATSSAEGIPQRPECLPFLIECGMRVDRHRDLDVTVADDVSHDVRRHAEVEQQRHARVPDVVKADIVEASRFPYPSPFTAAARPAPPAGANSTAERPPPLPDGTKSTTYSTRASASASAPGG
jgi:hypothetical protein